MTDARDAAYDASWGSPADAADEVTGERGLQTGGDRLPSAQPSAATRRYEVDVTVRETFTYLVEARNAKEAREVARNSASGVIETWANGDRQTTGVKTVRRAR